jgi:hypothetical protein
MPDRLGGSLCLQPGGIGVRGAEGRETGDGEQGNGCPSSDK